VAVHLVVERVKALQEERRNRVLLGINPDADLAEFSIHHIEVKAESEEYDPQWLEISETYLARAVTFFTRLQRATEEEPEPEPQPRNLATISTTDVREFADWLKTQPNNRGGYLGRQSRRQHLTVLSGVFARAVSEGKLPVGYNPVAALLDKPTAPKSKTAWLEIDELALLLESARVLMEEARTDGRRPPLPCAYEFLATFILTGARENEVRQLNIEDLDFASMTIFIAGTKTEGSDRAMPMHPQLREILEPYVENLGRVAGPLFTAPNGERVGDWRKTLDRIATRAGFPAKQIRTRVFRTSYITHRLACIDHGGAMEMYQVAREVGHSSLQMIMRVYGRVQRRRMRLTELAFRPESIGPGLQPRLQAVYAPPAPKPPPRLPESADLLKRFFEATSGMSTAEIVAATGLSKASVNRLRSMSDKTSLQDRTKEKITAFLSRFSASSADQGTTQPTIRPRRITRIAA